ncbi:hypothetical protein L2D08_15570 [Domibacillus sp. PGB-M46]|uniref:hypothetical protein n=1 Tax=Domibacillus sp. PGB-M46 TaxID=2910255 RepID=UPI001F57595D|nr:hypothetical protein [Domibacillus sp. PGB-M46]MCI2255785.1 hypothetical protein [Domibacillus sp. PGB-M46]
MFNKFKDKLTDISTNGLPIPITAMMLESLIKMKSDEQDIKVEITPEHLVLQGTTEVKKMMLKKNVSFTITLKPVQLEKRMIVFELVEIKPVDMNFINSKIFNRPPFLEYTNRTIKIDFNTWDIIKKIPMGNIKSYEFVDGAINIKLSL